MDGIIIVNKESGYTSHDVVAKLRRILGQKKIGHAGTLDPMAMGVLPVCIGKATRLADYIGEGSKCYNAVIQFGIETTTYDKEGTVITSKPCPLLHRAEIEAVLKRFKGEIMQVPPMVSAIKMNGQPLYKLAREGKIIERVPRKVNIYDISVFDYSDGDYPTVSCEIACSKGTYIRSLAHDAGELLKVGASLQQLTRVRVGEFHVTQAYTLSQIEELMRLGSQEFLLPSISAVKDKSQLIVNNALLHYVLHGNCIETEAADCSLCAVLNEEKNLIGIGHIDNGVLFMDKVLSDI